MKSLLYKIIKPIDQIERGQIVFELGFIKVILAILLWEISRAYIALMAMPFKDNYTAQGIVYILFIPLFVLWLTYILGKKSNKESFRNISFKIVSISIVIVMVYRFVYIYTIIPFILLLPENEILKGVGDILSNSSWVYSLGISCLFAPVVEEVFFRGIILKGISNKYNSKIGIFVSAALFGLVHMNLQQGIFAFLLGLVLGNIYNKTNSIYLVIICHSINNFMSLVL